MQKTPRQPTFWWYILIIPDYLVPCPGFLSLAGDIWEGKTRCRQPTECRVLWEWHPATILDMGCFILIIIDIKRMQKYENLQKFWPFSCRNTIKYKKGATTSKSIKFINKMLNAANKFKSKKKINDFWGRKCDFL